jgi:hypothetical protein
MEVLFPGEEVHGVKVVPWTLAQFVSLVPELRAAKREFEDGGITLDKIEERMLDVVVIVAPMIPIILMKSLPLSQEQVDALTMDKTIDLIVAVFQQNVDNIKNISGLKAIGKNLPGEMARSFRPSKSSSAEDTG